ncbi:hypothetical protein REC12_11540 [Desulfosporosinus sp. PR]|uniref:phage baseplate plug family protein n=1 Tax=Candidatus Desulfosporosinus nitrosoreducens TaxID=3401928 RepID=UPI0027FD8983|nr:hypothetical protein [Desulfosporosinus sp. PR]MDQ7094222.1 hypothetical protein [Desulfosporosinus sp. PR]
MSMMIIPTTSDPDQSFVTTIPVDGKNLKLRLRIRYNNVAGYWVMSISDPNTNALILDNIPLLAGGYPAADLLEQYSYLGLGSACIVNVGNSSMDSPDATTLGSDFLLAWGSAD